MNGIIDLRGHANNKIERENSGGAFIKTYAHAGVVGCCRNSDEKTFDRTPGPN